MAVFSKLLTQDDVESALSIASPSFDSLPYQEGDLFYMHVVDGTTARVFPCSIHRGEEGTGTSLLAVTWLEFVREKRARAGDMVVFQEKPAGEQEAATVFKIEVQRKIRLFGEDIWAGL